MVGGGICWGAGFSWRFKMVALEVLRSCGWFILWFADVFLDLEVLTLRADGRVPRGGTLEVFV